MTKLFALVSIFVLGVFLMTGCAEDKSKNPIVVLETTEGTIELELFPEVAPKHVENFVMLANDGFYDSVIFHRVIDGFMIQSGDPTGTGRGNSGRMLQAEFNDSTHRAGTLAMARSPQGPNTASSQFYICLEPRPELDHQYTVFGKTIAGMDVVRKIGKTPTSGNIQRVRLDSAWVAQLMKMKDEEGADIATYPDGTIMPDRPLHPIRIIKAYEKK